MAQCVKTNCVQECHQPRRVSMPIFDVVSADNLILVDKSRGTTVQLSAGMRLARAVEKIENLDLEKLEDSVSEVKPLLEVFQEDVDLLKQTVYNYIVEGKSNEKIQALEDRLTKLEAKPEPVVDVELMREIIHAEKNGTNVRTFTLPEAIKDMSIEVLKKQMDIFVNGVRQKTDSDENHYELTVENGVATATLNLDTFNPDEDCVYAVVSYISKAKV